MMGPLLLWSVVFATLAGARPLEQGRDLASLADSLICPLLALILGLDAFRRGGLLRGQRWEEPSRKRMRR